MYFDLIEIKPAAGGGWEVTHRQVEGDRMPRRVFPPSDLGFLHYPRKWGTKKGFKLVKYAMIKRHEVEIAKLTASLSALRQLELPPHLQHPVKRKRKPHES